MSSYEPRVFTQKSDIQALLKIDYILERKRGSISGSHDDDGKASGIFADRKYNIVETEASLSIPPFPLCCMQGVKDNWSRGSYPRPYHPPGHNDQVRRGR
jgi:hypothetical protein